MLRLGQPHPLRLSTMIAFVQTLLVVLATSLLIIGCIDGSGRAIIVALTFGAGIYAIHRRLPAFWWMVSALLVWSFCTSIREFFRTAHAPMLLMCSTLSTLTIALIASWWWRQREHFDGRRSLTRG